MRTYFVQTFLSFVKAISQCALFSHVKGEEGGGSYIFQVIKSYNPELHKEQYQQNLSVE